MMHQHPQSWLSRKAKMAMACAALGFLTSMMVFGLAKEKLIPGSTEEEQDKNYEITLGITLAIGVAAGALIGYGLSRWCFFRANIEIPENDTIDPSNVPTPTPAQIQLQPLLQNTAVEVITEPTESPRATG